MSSNLPLVRPSRRVLPWSGGLKLEINTPSQRIRAKWKGGLINEGGVISSEYSISLKYSSVLNTRSNDFIRRYIERVMSCMRENRFGSRCEG